MIPTRKVTVGMNQTPLSRRTRRALGIVTAAALAVPISMIGGSASNVVLASGSTPVGPPVFSPFSPPVPPVDGASGSNPHDSGLSPALLHNTGNQQALLTEAGPSANVPSGPIGIPGIVYQAYQRAQQTLAVTDPGCNLPWWLLAGIGKIESSQAENGEVDANGNTLRPILGPVLNGTNGSAAIPATPLSYQLTGDPNWQRAVGPMQFLPSTWIEYGAGGNPSNIYDAALAAGKYLCNGGRNLADPAQQAAAVFSYNHSNSYVAKVLLWAYAYAKGVTALPETPVPASLVDVNPPGSGSNPPPNSPTSTSPTSSSTSSPTSSSSTSPTTPSAPSSTSSTAPTTPVKPTTLPPCTPPPATTTDTTTTTTTPPPSSTTTTAPPPTCTTTGGDGPVNPLGDTGDQVTTTP